MKALVIGIIGYESHEASVRDAFVLGYNEAGGNITASDVVVHSVASLNFQTEFDYCKANNIPIMIHSYAGVSTKIDVAQLNYPDVSLFMPAGANSVGEIFSLDIPQVVCVTGAGDVANETADNVEFISHDPIGVDEQDYSSFSNPYIAGQIAFITDTLNCSIWEARYRAMQTGSESGIWHETNGYGFIDVDAAIAYSGSILSDPFIDVEEPEIPTEEPTTPIFSGNDTLAIIDDVRSEGNLKSVIQNDQIQPHLNKASIEIKRMLNYIDADGNYINLYASILNDENTDRKKDCTIAEANLTMSYAVFSLNIETAGDGIMQSKGFGETKNDLLSFNAVTQLSEHYRSVAMSLINPHLPVVDTGEVTGVGYLVGAL